jgi:hypothetical protein
VNTWGIRVEPGLVYEAGSEIRKFVGEWQLEGGLHEASSNDDYLDNTLLASIEYQPTTRLYGALRGSFRDDHDPRGTGRAEGVNTELLPDTELLQDDPDEWHSLGVESNLAYGARNATGRFELDLGYVAKDYDNNRLFTFIRDRNDLYAAGRFLYRIAPSTSLLIEGRGTDYSYDQHIVGVPGLNSEVYRVLGGLRWEVTGKTTGFAKLGYITKDFNAPKRADTDAVSWEVGLEWQPRTYSIWNFSTARDFQETNGAGNFIRHDNFDVSWKHFWLDRLSSEIDFGYAMNTFDPLLREDDLLNAGIRLDYLMRRWLTLGAGYHYGKRNSNDDFFDYERNLFEIVMRIAL